MSKTKQIIRIEHESDGYGMFISKDGRRVEVGRNQNEILPDLYERHKNFNSPHNDGLEMYFPLDRKGNWFCSFKSIEQLQEWVKPDELRILFENGFHILILDVSEWVDGEHQIIYTKESIVSQKDISDLFI